MVQPVGLAVLEQMGLAEKVRAVGARIDRLFGLAMPAGRTVLHVRYDWLQTPGVHGIGIHRAALFQILHSEVVAASLPIETDRTVTGSELLPDGRRCLRYADGTRSAAHELIIDALGTSSPLTPPTRRWLHYGALWASLDWTAGFDSTTLEQRYVRANVMTGVLPIGSAPGCARDQAAFFWLLRANRVDEWRERGLERWKNDVRRLWPLTASLLDQIQSVEQLVFARYAHRTIGRPAEPALVHIGDAWHSTSPQLGQGANMALLDAWAVAKALREKESLEAAIGSACASRRFHVRLYQALSALFTPAYQSDSRLLPIMRDWLVPPFSSMWPATWIQAAMVAGLIGSPLKPLGLAAAVLPKG
jgi:2-polyprenyl-6-methoxyphenol hydroxylase-like FAD-dependent oxidoreductase